MRRGLAPRRHLHYAIRYLGRHLQQSLMTGSGIALALCLLTLTNASRRGTHESMMEQFQGLGQNAALIFAPEDRLLPERFYSGIRQLCDNRGWSFIPVFEEAATVNAANLPLNTRILLTTPAFLQRFQPHLVRGRLLQQEDAHMARLLIGSTVAAESGQQNPTHLKLNGLWYQVIGEMDQLQAGGSQVHQYLDVARAVLVIRDLDTLRRGRMKFALIETRTADEITNMASVLNGFLEEENLAVQLDLRLPLKQRDLTARSENLLLAHGTLVSMVCLLLSSLGILISYHLQLNYRREEFGTLVALGASARLIGGNLFMEVLLLSGCSGILGLVLGIVGGHLWAFIGAMPMSFHLLDLLYGLAVLLVVALLTGSVPALMALRLDPIQLLRLNR